MIIPEIVVQRVLVNGIRRIRNIPWKSDQLFKSVPQSFAQQFYELIQSTPIDITINYPREDSQFPCIAILLRAEEESDIFLGDLLSAGYDDTDRLFGSEGLFYMKGETSSLADDTYGLALGLGQGEKYEDTPKIFDKSVQKYKERRGSGYSCSYLLQVMTDDQDFTIFMYHLVRYILMAGIPTFTTNGMHQIRFSGTDFLPQAAQQPNFIFMRGINMNFLYFADHYLVEGDEGLEAAAKAFVIDMGNAWGDTPDMLAEVQKPLITAVSVVTAATGTSVTGIAVAGINFQNGLTIEFIKSTPGSTFDVLGSDAGLVVSNISVGSTEFKIEFTPVNSGITGSTKKIFSANVADVVPTTLSAGMFLEVIGPKSHATYGEKRRIISFTSGDSGTITVANDFSASLAGVSVQVIKESSVETVTSVDGHAVTKKFTFDLTISTAATIGVWDIKVTNPDLISTTLTKSFTIT
tara:strand:+ start:827 stop:2221 length:1395 start_codon:yes stop_codon:yes gene_type:complete